jgi:hypothetical protein
MTAARKRAIAEAFCKGKGVDALAYDLFGKPNYLPDEISEARERVESALRWCLLHGVDRPRARKGQRK